MIVKKISLVLVAALALFVSSCETRQESIDRENRYISEHPPEDVAKYYRDVTYAEVAGEKLTLDVSVPDGEGPFPVLMIIHGGGWSMHTNTIMEGMARYITNRGYVVFNVNYRVLPNVDMKTIVEDCLGALLWVKDHASEYKGDSTRVAVTGDSAGGHLTAMLVTQAEDPAFKPTYSSATKDFSLTCAVPTYGIYDFIGLSRLSPGIAKSFLGAGYKENPELYRLLSPYYHVRKDLAPQLVMVGTADFLYSENIKYVKALEKAGAPVELWKYPGKPHAFLNEYWNDNGRKGYDRMVEFLDKHMKQ